MSEPGVAGAQRRSFLVGSLLPALVALPPRLASIQAVGFNPAFFDVDSYHALALAGFSGPIPSDYHPPGYAWFLMALYRLVGPRPRLAYLVQALLSAVAVLLVAEIARRRWGTRSGLAAGLVLALSGYLSIFPSVLASETLCLFGTALVAFLAFGRTPAPPGRLLAAAAAAGLLALARTGFVLVAFALVLVLLAQQANALRELLDRRKAALIAAILVLGFAPLLAQAVLRAGRGEPFRVGCDYDEVNLWIGNNPLSTGRMEAMPEFLPGGRAEKLSNPERARLLGPEARRYLFGHPLRQLELVAKRASYLFAPAKRDILWLYGMGWAGEKPATFVRAVYAWVAASVPILLMLALAGLWKRWDDPVVRGAMALALAGALPYLASIGDARYLQPLHPLFALAAGAAFAAAGGMPPSRVRRIVVVVLAAAIVANAAYDLALTEPAVRELLRPGAVGTPIPYIFAR